MLHRIFALTLVFLTILTPITLIAPSAARAESTQTPFRDYGDAPDSTNNPGQAMLAYPGVTANFPTAVQSTGIPGPVHTAVPTRLVYVLGYGVSAEDDADNGNDDDVTFNNIVPQLDMADNDGRDDGVALPATLPHCTPVEMQVAVTVFDRGQDFPERAFVNLWLDFDRNGQWGEQMTCPDTTIAKEWAVANHAITLPNAGTHIITLPAFVAWNTQPGQDMWLRATLSEKAAPAADGSGPVDGYERGETEDYRLEGVGSPLPPATIPPLQVGDLKAHIPFKMTFPLLALPPGLDMPDEVAAPSGKLRETDVVHLGGSYEGPTIPIIVTVIGTGYVGKLSSWTTNNVAAPPVYLKDGPPMIGYDHQLHVLTPPKSPKLAREMLVSALIRNGNLWLTTWNVSNDGTLQQLDTRGYGENDNVTVDHYTIAHRPLVVTADEKRHQVVTPILHDSGKLRMVTWEVNGITGHINGKSDSGDVAASAAEDTDISAVFAEGEGFVGPHYTVSLINKNGMLANFLWDVTTNGVPSLRGSAASGRDIQNANNFPQVANNVALAPLNDTGFFAAINVPSGSLKMLTWENLVGSCSGTCQYVPSNISDNTLDMNQAGNGIQQPLPAITTIRAMLYDPLYDDDVYTKDPDTVQAIASVRKVMVTIVALDAVADGDVSLDDDVTVSTAAANINNTGASVMGLQVGEVISLRNLLYGNMMVSAGDATWAIAEHVGGSVGGMVDLMNLKANELNLSNTFHCQAGTTFSNVSYSTAREQALLWASVYNDPLFLDFAGASSKDVCGVLPGDIPICHPAIPPMTKNMSVYPNLDGHKTGGGGGLCPSEPAYDAVPTCVGGGCLSVQSTRLQRPLIISELQPSGQTGNRWPDALTLFDYGYRQIFTPDFRSTSGNAGGTATDFGLDYLNDGHAVAAVLNDSKELTLCNWAMSPGLNSISKGGCANHTYNGLAAGLSQQPPTSLDMVRISTLESEGDYLVGRIEDNILVLRLWRVGDKNF